MNRFCWVILLLFYALSLDADNKNPGEPRVSVIKIESDWVKTDTETATLPPNSNFINLAEGISYSSTKDGLFLNLKEPAGKVKLLSLTGEAVWQGSLVQGKFLIPTRQGIYFLRINNKSYKLICK